MAEVKIDAKNARGPVELRVGDTLVINVDENPTTGYRWQVSVGDQLVASADRFIPSGDTAVGGGGIRTLSFGVVSPGRGTVKLQLRREWETDKAPDSLDISYEARPD